jgi:hypothetical protein
MNRRKYFIFLISAILAALLVVGCGGADDLVVPDPNSSSTFVISPLPESIEPIRVFVRNSPSEYGEFLPNSRFWKMTSGYYYSGLMDSLRVSEESFGE